MSALAAPEKIELRGQNRGQPGQVPTKSIQRRLPSTMFLHTLGMTAVESGVGTATALLVLNVRNATVTSRRPTPLSLGGSTTRASVKELMNKHAAYLHAHRAEDVAAGKRAGREQPYADDAHTSGLLAEACVAMWGRPPGA